MDASIRGGSLLAVALVFIAGVVTSVGPCLAPRYVAVAAYAAESGKPFATIGSFVAGLVAAHLPIGLVGLAIGSVALLGRYSTFVNLVMAVGLLGVGVYLVIWPQRHADHTHSDTQAKRSTWSMFGAGAAFAFALSPCCTPPI